VFAFTVVTDVFEGPLDLLLHLVRREGIDVRQIPMARIADAYLDTLERMKDLNLSIASDYLVMAATLTHLKSLELLPRLPTLLEDEEEDPRQALTRQLVEYERIKRAAEALDQQITFGRDVFARPPEPMDNLDRPVSSPIDAFGLLDLFYEMLRRQSAPPPVHEVGTDAADVGACCRRVLEILNEHDGTGELGAILRGLTRPGERVVTFIGVLEMVRLRWIDAEQAEHLGPVRLKALVRPDVDIARVTAEVVTTEPRGATA
jgi:segregation and condensation protein A